ncbi:MAG: ABC transporter permease, partial [Nitrospirota bacterium]
NVGLDINKEVRKEILKGIGIESGTNETGEEKVNLKMEDGINNHEAEQAIRIKEDGEHGPSISYMDWLKNVIQGEFGRGKSGQSVSEEIMQKLPVTFIISFASIVPAVLVSFFIGLFNDSRSVNAASNIIYLLTALPAFFLGYLLIAIFGYYPNVLINYLFAIFSLGLSSGIINEMGRFVNSSMKKELSRDYIETAIAKGLRETNLPLPGTIGFHAFRNALIGIMPRIGALFALIISGSMIVEQVFGLNGISFMLLDGLAEKDRTRVLIVVFMSVILVRIGTITSNLFYLLLNPRYGQR